MADTTIQEQIVREAPEIEAYKLGLLQSAKGLADMPVGGFELDPATGMQAKDAQGNPLTRPKPQGLPEREFVAPTALQNAAITTAQTGIGQYAPYLQQAQEAMTGGIGQLGNAAALFQQTTAAPTSAEIQQYMNPYQQAVTDEISRQFEQQRDLARSKAIQAGAFGGDRESVLMGQLGKAEAQTIAQAQAANFAQALQQAQQQRAFQQQAAQGLGGLGLGQAQLGQGIAGLGALGEQLGQGTAGFQFQLGEAQRGLGQQAADVGYQTQLQQAYEPYQRLGFLSDIYKGAPTSQQTISTVTAPSVSPLVQAAGLGIAGLSGLAGAKTAGLF